MTAASGLTVGTRPKKASSTKLNDSWPLAVGLGGDGDDAERVVDGLGADAGVVVPGVASDEVGGTGGGLTVLMDVVVTTTTGFEEVVGSGSVGSCVMKDGFCLSTISSLPCAVPRRQVAAARTTSHHERPRGAGMVKMSLVLRPGRTREDGQVAASFGSRCNLEVVGACVT